MKSYTKVNVFESLCFCASHRCDSLTDENARIESLVETKCKLRQCELYSTKNLDKLGKPYLQENYICVLQW